MKLKLTFDTSEELSCSMQDVHGNNMPRCHSHDNYEMYFLAHGSRYLFAGDGFYSIERGDAFLVAPGVEHRTLDSGEGEYSRLTVMIPRHLMPRDCIPEGGVKVVRPSAASRDGLFAAAEELRRLSHGEFAGQGALVLSAAMRMLSALAREPHREGIANASPAIERVSEILGYIEAHFAEPLSLTALSSRFFISEYYLCRIFKEHTGRTVLEYLTAQRLRRAAELLTEGKRRIGEVRRLSGFGSDSAFSKAFVREYGTSPRDFARQKKREKELKM